ncbi:efflux transporter outer membrane subunit [Variovorax paradoxus]|uniref:efflux transporter outer membrane subunit n=1 Tax=Variovorax paradoxus TaxID=34073 RepID=UPI0029C6F00D|nr:efflux transporter outer membrane subunit [Variovorax paradoxus]WPH18083.1 efflux transporter outer membrane subunit [Variovorax paradoxus]
MAIVLAACASTAPAVESESASVQVATQWHAPHPHGGRVDDLRQWWSRFDDPLIPHLIEAAQRASPTLAQAAANMADARASSVMSGAALLPSLDIAASATRGRSELAAPVGSVSSLGLETAWELDLFGANRAGLAAAEARLASSQAGWHDARVSVAADVATRYADLRACEAHFQQAQIDAASRVRTSRLTGLAAAGGIRSPATADLARASAAQGEVAVEERKARCDLLIKALVALTAQDEPSLRNELAAKTAQLPQPAGFSVNAVPAMVLAQRPDIHAAALSVAAASFDSTQAKAQRWPRIALAGSIGATRGSSLGVSTDGTVWSVGPVAITFPVFDGGMRRADAQAAKVRYESATTLYAARLRTAIQEVEGALVTLESTARRSESASVAVDGFERSYRAAATSYDVGAASLFDLEDARRSVVSAQSTLIDLRRERLLAWVSLYRAMGGGWSPEADDHPAGHPGPAAAPMPGKLPRVGELTGPRHARL